MKQQTARDTKLHKNALKALKEAVAQVIEEHRQRNLPLAFWENGKVRMVSPKEIPR